MKKRMILMLCVICVCVGLLSVSAATFTVTALEPEDVFTPEIIEQEKVSDWASNEI